MIQNSKALRVNIKENNLPTFVLKTVLRYSRTSLQKYSDWKVKIYKELTWLHSRKINNPIKKWAKDLNRHFSEEDILRAQRHMKGYSGRCILKPQWDTISHQSEWPSLYTSTNSKCWWGCAEKGTLVHCWWEWFLTKICNQKLAGT